MTRNGAENLSDRLGRDALPPPSWPALPATLTEICLCLTEVVPAAESAGVVIFPPDPAPPTQRPSLDRADVVGAAPAGAAVLHLEKRLGEGPVLTACRSQRLVLSGNVSGDERWPQFGSAVVNLQLHSAAAVPLTGTNGVTGAVLSIYSHQRDAFDTHAVHLIAAVAAVARTALLAAAMVESTRRAHAAVNEARDRSRLIDQAVGVLLHRNCNEEQARARLARMADRSGGDLTDAALTLIEEASTEARLNYLAPWHPIRSDLTA